MKNIKIEEALQKVNQKNALEILKLKKRIKEDKQEKVRLNKIIKFQSDRICQLSSNLENQDDIIKKLYTKIKWYESEMELLAAYKKDVARFQRRDQIYIESENKVKNYDLMVSKFTREIEALRKAHTELELLVDETELKKFYATKLTNK